MIRVPVDDIANVIVDCQVVPALVRHLQLP